MGWRTAARDKAARRRSDLIDKRIEEDSPKHRKRKEHKVLVLDSGESEISTIVKQMKIIHQNGCTPEELAVYRPVVYKNLIDSAKDIVLAMKEIGVDCVEGVNRVYAQQILAYEVESDLAFVISADIANAIESVWKDPIIPTVLDRSSEFHLMDSAPYFFSQVARICEHGYVPNESDVLRSRTKTTGIAETSFDIGELTIHMCDMSNHRSELKKWIHCFEGVTSIIFGVALNKYDQPLLKNKEQNQMKESLVLFESVVNSHWFLRTSIILFLTKIDLFKAKLPKVPLDQYFPEYTGGADINKAAKYILWRFTQVNRARLSLYPHLTQTNDTSNVRLVFAAVKETVLTNALRNSRIL